MSFGQSRNFVLPPRAGEVYVVTIGLRAEDVKTALIAALVAHSSALSGIVTPTRAGNDQDRLRDILIEAFRAGMPK